MTILHTAGRTTISIKSIGDGGDPGSFEGYGSVFNVVDSYKDVVRKGAFVDSIKSIKTSGNPLPVLWQHNAEDVIGSYSEMSEDDHGLMMKGSILIDNGIPEADKAYKLMKAKLVTGLSIGYMVTKGTFNEKDNVYDLLAVDLVETSIVTFPANKEAQIAQVKRAQAQKDTRLAGALMLAANNLPDPLEFKRHLTFLGFRSEDAEAIVVKGLQPLIKQVSGTDAGDSLMAALKELGASADRFNS